jgi:hypothetical protein
MSMAEEEDPAARWIMLIDTALARHDKDIARLKRKVKALTMLLEAERVPPKILRLREQMRGDAVARARDMWGLDYAEIGEGFYPAGNQIGRRYLLPQDFGLKTWYFEKRDEYTPDPSPETREAEAKKLGRHSILEYCRVDEEAFLILHGFKYKPFGSPKLQSIEYILSGTMIPPLTISFTNARIIGGYYTVNLEGPIALQPKSQFDLTAFLDDLGPHAYELGIFGEVIGRRSYIIIAPHNLLTRR